MKALQIGGWINLMIAALHALAIFRMRDVASWVGAGAEMDQSARVFFLLPHLATLAAALVFALFGVCALSAAGALPPLFATTPAVVGIALIFLMRAIGGFGVGGFLEDSTLKEQIFSGLAMGVGLLYAVGADRLLTLDEPGGEAANRPRGGRR